MSTVGELRAMCEHGIGLNECDLAAAVPALLDVAEAVEALRRKRDEWVDADDGSYFDSPTENRALFAALDRLNGLLPQLYPKEGDNVPS